MGGGQVAEVRHLLDWAWRWLGGGCLGAAGPRPRAAAVAVAARLRSKAAARWRVHATQDGDVLESMCAHHEMKVVKRMPQMMEPRTFLAMSTVMTIPPVMPSHKVAERMTPPESHW